MDDAVLRLTRLRQLLGQSQRELAAELGVAPSALAQWETGVHAIPGPVLRLLDHYEEHLGLGRAVVAPSLPPPSTVSSFWHKILEPASGGTLVRRAREAAARRFLVELRAIHFPLRKLAPWSSLESYLRAEVDASDDKQARPMSPAQVIEVLVSELGAPPRQLFASWTTTPMAITSLGQVHAAELADGRSVAVKVQRLGARHGLVAEMRRLERAAALLGLVFPALGAQLIWTEIRDRALEEFDYLLEAQRLTQMRRLFSSQTGLCIPAVVHELSARRVLTTELADGRSFAGFAEEASPSERNRAGQALWRFYFTSLLRHHMYHGDVVPAHYLFGASDVTVLDFGRVAQVGPAFGAAWRRMLRAVLERAPAAFEEAVVALGVVSDRRRFDFEVTYRNVATISRPWLVDGDFTFSSAYTDKLWVLATVGSRNRFTTRFVPEMVMLPNLYGLVGLLARLGAQVECRQLVLDLLYEPSEPRPSPYQATELGLLGV